MSLYLWITLGSALGGLARFVLPGFAADRIGEIVAWETLVENFSGSFQCDGDHRILYHCGVAPVPLRCRAERIKSALTMQLPAELPLFLPDLDRMVDGGLVALGKVWVLHCRNDAGASAAERPAP